MKNVFKYEETDGDSIAFDRISSVVNPIVNKQKQLVETLKLQLGCLQEKYADEKFSKERVKMKSQMEQTVLKRANEMEFRSIRMEFVYFKTHIKDLLKNLKSDIGETTNLIKKTKGQIKKRIKQRQSILEKRELKLKQKEEKFEKLRKSFKEEVKNQTLQERYDALLESQRRAALKHVIFKNYFELTSKSVRENEEGDNPLQKLLMTQIVNTNRELVMFKRNKKGFGTLTKSPKRKKRNLFCRSKSSINLKGKTE